MNGAGEVEAAGDAAAGTAAERRKGQVVLLFIHFNNPAALKRSLDSFGGDLSRFSTIAVLDNGSRAESLREAKQLLQPYRVKWIESTENCGWGRGVNVALRHLDLADDAIVCISAHDTIKHDGHIDALLEPLADPGVASVSPQYANGPLIVRYDALRGVRPRPCASGFEGEVEIGHGTFCALRASALRIVGGFDETYFIYLCESEVFIRLRRAGFRHLLTPRMRIVNPGCDATGEFTLRAFTINSLHLAAQMGWHHYLLRLAASLGALARSAAAGHFHFARVRALCVLWSIGTGAAGFRAWRVASETRNVRSDARNRVAESRGNG